jgi:hypothetical protein
MFEPDQNHPEHLCWENLASANQAAATWKMECETLRERLKSWSLLHQNAAEDEATDAMGLQIGRKFRTEP